MRTECGRRATNGDTGPAPTSATAKIIARKNDGLIAAIDPADWCTACTERSHRPQRIFLSVGARAIPLLSTTHQRYPCSNWARGSRSARSPFVFR